MGNSLHRDGAKNYFLDLGARKTTNQSTNIRGRDIKHLNSSLNGLISAMNNNKEHRLLETNYGQKFNTWCICKITN